MTAVPLVDLTPWYEGTAAGRRQVATEVDRAFCELGSLVLTGHPVGAPLRDRLRAEARQFFTRPVAEKAEVACFPGGRGWTPPVPGPGTRPDPRESFGSGPERTPPSVVGTPEEDWFGPDARPASTPGLLPAATAFADCCGVLADDLLRVFALALDLADDHFTGRCAGGPWSVDLTWVPAGSAAGPVQHSDVATFTVTDRPAPSDGVQVRTSDGAWVDVPFVPGGLTVAVGDLLARWTGDRWRTAPHRVLPPAGTAAELLWLVFSHAADPFAVVERLPTAAAGPTRYEPVTAGRFRRDRMDSVVVG